MHGKLSIKKQWTHNRHTTYGPSECCQKKLTEIKNMYAKKNLPSQVAAKEKLMFVGYKYILKKEQNRTIKFRV